MFNTSICVTIIHIMTVLLCEDLPKYRDYLIKNDVMFDYETEKQSEGVIL